jgi:hypothetical protein
LRFEESEQLQLPRVLRRGPPSLRTPPPAAGTSFSARARARRSKRRPSRAWPCPACRIPQYAESRVLTPDPESCTSQTRRWVAFFFFCFVFFLDEYMFLLLSPRATNRTLEALDAILKPHANCRIARLSNFERWIRAHPSFSGAAAEAAVAAAVADRGARCSESSPFPPVNIDGCCGVCSHL